MQKNELRNHRFVWQMTSKILTTFPTVLNEFKSKQARLIYRGTDDGFGSSSFHSKCDGIANTITIILTTDDFIFGGFTPIVILVECDWHIPTMQFIRNLPMVQHLAVDMAFMLRMIAR
jgi:hypothetical protein